MASLNSLVAIYGLYDVIFNVEILKNGKNMCKKLKFYLLQADWKSLRLSHFIVFLQWVKTFMSSYLYIGRKRHL